MRRRLVHAILFVVGVVACAYVSVVLGIGTTSVMQWMKRGVPERAFWVALAAAAMLVPGIVIAWVSVWFLRSRRQPLDPRQGFDVLPPR
jgi:hypothetical protein